MKLVTTNHPLEQLNRALREADVVLVPIDANDADPFPGSMSDILRTLCTSPMARALITRASARWTVSAATAQDPLEPRVGLIVLALPIQRTLAGGRFAAVTLLSDAIDGETVDQLAHSARIDARIARTILATNAPWERRSVKRLARLVASLARSEGERLVGVEAGTRLSAA